VCDVGRRPRQRGGTPLQEGVQSARKALISLQSEGWHTHYFDGATPALIEEPP